MDKLISTEEERQDFDDRLESLKRLLEAARVEHGFSPGLLGCFRARAADLVAEILKLTPVKHPESTVTVEPDPRKEAERKPFIPRVFHGPNKRVSPRKFLYPNPQLVRLCLDMALQGASNREIEASLGISAAMAYKLRSRSLWVSRHHPAIDAWSKLHPGVQFPVWNRSGQQKQVKP